MFYNIFTRLCTQKEVTPSAVMRAIGLNKSSATYWKKGSIPSSDTLQKLADYFGVSVDYLLGTKPLAPKKIDVTDTWSTTLNSSNQEYLAFTDFLKEIGYTLVFELNTFDNINPEMKWTLYDNRRGKKYFVSGDRLNQLAGSVTSFTKYQVSEMILELVEVPQSPGPAPQPPPQSSEGTDTTPTTDAPETPPEGK